MVKVQADSNGKVILLQGRALEAADTESLGAGFLVQVVDYDGTVLKSERLEEGSTFTLPSQPTHTGLVFQSWSSPVTITNNTVTVTNSDITIGATYTTASGLTEFDITLTEDTGLDVTLTMNGTKNWGDGTTDTATAHTYVQTGDYTITCDGDTMTSSYNSGLFGQSSDFINYYLKNIKIGNNITSLGYSVFQYCYSLKSVTIPNGVTIIDTSAFDHCCSLVSITIPNGVTGIDSNAFQYCYSLVSAAIPSSVTNISNHAFHCCYSLISATIPNGVTRSISAFLVCYSLTSITIPNGVTGIGLNAFKDCYSLTNVVIPSSITSIGDNAFYNCYSLASIIIPDGVTSIGSSAFSGCYSLLEYDFSNCTVIPTLSSTGVFYGINKTCKIYVPWDLYESWKSATNWSTYANYITNKNPATLNFTISPSGNSTVYVNSRQIVGTSTSWVGSSASYVVYDSTNNIVYPGTQSGITEGATVNITVDLTNYSKITLSTGVSGLSAVATINGVEIPMVEETSGNYAVNVVGSGTVIGYSIYGGSNYMDASGTITTTGSDMSESVTMTPAIDTTWTRPNLTADGTLGGNSFAVYSPTQYSNPYRAVDDSTSTYWGYYNSGNQTYIFYNPEALRVTEITYTYNSSSYRATLVTIQGSNDNSKWVDITSTYSGSNITYTSTLTNDKYYKYYKLVFAPNSSYIWVYDMAITATYKVPSS